MNLPPVCKDLNSSRWMAWTSAALASHNATPPPLNPSTPILPPPAPPRHALDNHRQTKKPACHHGNPRGPNLAHTHAHHEEVWRRRLSSDADGGRNTFFFSFRELCEPRTEWLSRALIFFCVRQRRFNFKDAPSSFWTGERKKKTIQSGQTVDGGTIWPHTVYRGSSSVIRLR